MTRKTIRNLSLSLSLLTVLVVAGGGILWLSTRLGQTLDSSGASSSVANAVQREEATRLAAADARAAAYHKREPVAGRGSTLPKEAGRTRPVYDYGTIQGVDPNLNGATKAVVEAIKTGTHPERFSVMHHGEPLDIAAWKRNPEEVAFRYAATPEPGRVFQPAQPGKGVQPIKSLGDTYREVLQTEPTDLTVKTLPFAPVTFTSFDLGCFGNRLNTQTVVADAQGQATATFTAGSGTAFNVNILASSPVTSGRVEYLIWVKPPFLEKGSATQARTGN